MSKIPFDIKYRPQIESGEYRVETRDGKKVRVLCYDANNIVPIVALVTFNDGSEGSRDYYLNGTMNFDRENPLDLFIVTPEPELSEFEERIFKLLRQYKECDIPLTPENIKADASILWSDFEKYFFDLYGKEGEGDSALRSFYYRGLECGKAKALKDRAAELTKQLNESGLDENDIEYDLIEFMCNLMDCPNWNEIVETAGLHADRIKAEAVKDVPRWEDIRNFAYSWTSEDKTFYNDTLGQLFHKGKKLFIGDLEKLPGFKEDDK